MLTGKKGVPRLNCNIAVVIDITILPTKVFRAFGNFDCSVFVCVILIIVGLGIVHPFDRIFVYV